MLCRLLVLASTFLFACGGATADDTSPGSTGAPPTFVMARDTCSTGVQPSADAALAKADSSEAISVAEIRFIDECSGLGGHWIIGRDISSDRKFFLGAHGCRLWSSPPAGSYAVVRHAQTAGISFTPSGVCIRFDGEDSVRTDQSTSGIVVFTALEDAKAFASARGWRG